MLVCSIAWSTIPSPTPDNFLKGKLRVEVLALDFSQRTAFISPTNHLGFPIKIASLVSVNGHYSSTKTASMGLHWVFGPLGTGASLLRNLATSASVEYKSL